jgi:hypothetical protein
MRAAQAKDGGPADGHSTARSKAKQDICWRAHSVISSGLTKREESRDKENRRGKFLVVGWAAEQGCGWVAWGSKAAMAETAELYVPGWSKGDLPYLRVPLQRSKAEEAGIGGGGGGGGGGDGESRRRRRREGSGWSGVVVEEEGRQDGRGPRQKCLMEREREREIEYTAGTRLVGPASSI